MDTLISMRTFRAVAEQGSFISASNRLDQSAAMTSKHVRHLEERLGVRLLNRNSRNVSLTDAGREYLTQLAQTLDALDEVESAISETTYKPKGNLRISAPVWVACAGFATMLTEFQRTYPDVKLSVDLTGRLVDLVEESIDVALRVSDSPGEHYIARKVSQVSFDWVAAPACFERFGRPETLNDLSEYPVLWYSGIPMELDLSEVDQSSQEKLQLDPILISGNETLLHHAALQGMGVVLLPNWFTASDLDNGNLIKVFENQPGYTRSLSALYSSRKHLSSKVRVFIDFMVSSKIV